MRSARDHAGAAHRPVRADDGRGRAAQRRCRPALRLRGVRALPARAPALRRRRRPRPAARRIAAGSGSTTTRWRSSSAPTSSTTPPRDWLSAYRFTGSIDCLRRGRGVLPGLAGAHRRRQLRGMRRPRDAGAVDPQPRQRGRDRGGADGLRRGLAAVHRDGVAPYPRGSGGGERPRRLHRRLRRQLQPRRRRPLGNPDDRHRGARLHPGPRRRARGVHGAGRRARARAPRCSSTPTTSSRASAPRSRSRARSSARSGSTPATCRRRPATPAGCWTSSARRKHPDRRDERPRRVLDRRTRVGAGRRVRRRHVARHRKPVADRRLRLQARRPRKDPTATGTRSRSGRSAKRSHGGRKTRRAAVRRGGVAIAEMVRTGGTPETRHDERPLQTRVDT